MPVARIAQIAVGGAIGASLRWALLDAFGGSWSPEGILFVINVVGSFALGLVWARSQDGAASWPRPLLGIGLCGGFTSFSGFALHIAEHLDDGRLGTGAVWTAVTVLFALAAVAFGHTIGRRGAAA